MFLQFFFAGLFRDVILAACIAIVAAGVQAASAPTEVRLGFGLTKPPYVMESDKEGIEIEIAEQALAEVVPFGWTVNSSR